MRELADIRYSKNAEYEAKISSQNKEIKKLRQENQKISEYQIDDLEKQREEIQKLQNISAIRQQKNIDLENQLKKQNKELEELRERIQEMNEKQRRELKKHKEEMDEIKTTTTLNSKTSKEIEILDSEEVRDLDIIDEIGYGGGGKIFKVARKKYYALKQMNIQNASHTNLQHFIAEYEIMNMLNHPNILKTHGIFFSDESLPPSILLEYCPMNLEQAIKKKQMNKVELAYTIYQIAEGMKYVHFRKIIHRDLKPSNILISDDGTAKICDFGISRLMTGEEQSMTKGIGTQKFMAPEIINEENYNEKVDVYSFGVLVYFIVTGGELPNIKIKEICEGKIPELPTTFPFLAQQLIEACWIFNPKDRPSFGMICEILDDNDYDLLLLSKNEIKEVTRIISHYKSTIPKYNE